MAKHIVDFGALGSFEVEPQPTLEDLLLIVSGGIGCIGEKEQFEARSAITRIRQYVFVGGELLKRVQQQTE